MDNSKINSSLKRAKIREILKDPDQLLKRVDDIFDIIKAGIPAPFGVECETSNFHEKSHIEMHIKYNGFPSFYQTQRIEIKLSQMLNSDGYFQKKFNDQIAKVRSFLYDQKVIDEHGKETQIVEIPGPQFSALEDAKIIMFIGSSLHDKNLKIFHDEDDNFAGFFRCTDQKTNYYLEKNFFNRIMTEANEKD